MYDSRLAELKVGGPMQSFSLELFIRVTQEQLQCQANNDAGNGWSAFPLRPEQLNEHHIHETE